MNWFHQNKLSFASRVNFFDEVAEMKHNAADGEENEENGFPIPPYIEDDDVTEANIGVKECLNRDDDLTSGGFINELKYVDNPYYSQNAYQKKGKDYFSDFAIKFYTEKCLCIEAKDFKIQKRDNVTPEREIGFMRDNDIVCDEVDIKSNVLCAYFKDNDEVPKREYLKTMRAPPIENMHFVNLKFTKYQMQYEQISPLMFSGKILSEKKYISEEWTFYPEKNVELYHKYFNDLEISLKDSVLFEVPDLSVSNFLVIILSHILSVGGSEDLVKYYVSGKSDAAQKSFYQSWPRNNKVFTPFAWTFIDINDLISNEKIKLSNFYSLDQQPTAAYMRTLVDAAKKEKLKPKFKMEMLFDVHLESITHMNEIENSKYEIYRLLNEPKEIYSPNILFNHKVQLILETANFKMPSSIKGRNIFCVVSLRNNLKSQPLMLHHSKVKNGYDSQGITKCYYHFEKGIWDETFVFDLPYPMDDELCFVIEFYHLQAQEKDKSDNRYIGFTYIPLITKEGSLIESNTKQYNIYYSKIESFDISAAKTKLEQSNCLNATVYFDTLLSSSDRKVVEFLKSGGESNVISEMNLNSQIRFFYIILDLLINNLNSEKLKNILPFIALSESVDETIGTNYLKYYATSFALRNNSKSFHTKLMKAWSNYFIKKNPDEPRKDNKLMEFFFILILKSIKMEEKSLFAIQFMQFVFEFTRSITEEQNPSNTLVVYSCFINGLFDCGACSHAIYAIYILVETMISKKSNYLEKFLTEVLKPKLFYISIMKFDIMKKMILDLINHGKNKLDFVFPLLINIISLYSKDIQHEIATRIIEAITILSPLQQKGNDNQITPEQVFYIYLLENLEYTNETSLWWEKLSNLDEIEDSFYLLIRKIQKNATSNDARTKELLYSAEASILNMLKFMLNDKETLKVTVSIFYILQFQRIIVSSLYNHFIILLTDIATKDINYFLDNVRPAPPLLFKNLFLQSRKSPYISDFFLKLLIAEQKSGNSFNRMNPLIFRALFMLKKDELFHIKLTLPEKAQNESSDITFNSIINTIRILGNIEAQLESNNIDPNAEHALRFKKIELIRSSPDSVLEELEILYTNQKAQGYESESFQTTLLQAAIITEYLTLQKKIPPIFGTIHAAHAFDRVCSISSLALHGHDECPRLNGYCDSKFFNFRSLISLLYSIMKKSLNSQWETGQLLLDIIWPFYEYTRSYNNLARVFKLQKTLVSILENPKFERVFGNYFKVSFYGDCFKNRNDKAYIFHEKGLIHLYDFSNELIQKNQEENPNIKIELIKEKGEVDKSKLSDDKGYIQVTFVEPYFSKNELKLRRTVYDKNSFISKFYFDCPFLKDSKKIQGEVDEQWIRRTIVSVKYPMPFISKIQEMSNLEVKEYPPIRVSYRQLHDQLISFEKAIESADTTKIQQLLHGTLLAQVNVGPCKIAEVFLSKVNEIDNNARYIGKLKRIFSSFIPVIKCALDIHGKMVQSQTEFRPLQDQLEAGYISFVDTLSKYI